MLVVGLIGIEHMQSVIKVSPPPKNATILVIWKPSDRETPVDMPFIDHFIRGVCHNIEKLSILIYKKVSAVSEPTET